MKFKIEVKFVKSCERYQTTERTVEDKDFGLEMIILKSMVEAGEIMWFKVSMDDINCKVLAQSIDFNRELWNGAENVL